MADLKEVKEKVNLSNVNFTRYQTDELRTAIEEILSITGNLAFFLRTLVLVWIMGPIVMPLLFSGSDTWVKVIWGTYGAVAFFFMAVSLGIFFTKRRLLGNILTLVDIVFEVCSKVLDDLGQIKSRGVGITAVALVSNVDGSVIRPVVEGVLRSKLGFFSRPLLWMYKGTVGNIIKVIEKTLLDMAVKEDAAVAEDSGALQEPEQDSQGLVERAESATLQLRDFMTRAQEVSLSAASKITKFAMIPSFLISLVIAVIAFLPVLLVKI